MRAALIFIIGILLGLSIPYLLRTLSVLFVKSNHPSIGFMKMKAILLSILLAILGFVAMFLGDSISNLFKLK